MQKGVGEMPPVPCAELPRTPPAHFKLYCLAAAAHICAQVAETYGSREAALEQFPFLAGYEEEWADFVPCELAGAELDEWWRDALAAWEQTAAAHLPLRALREAYQLEYG